MLKRISECRKFVLQHSILVSYNHLKWIMYVSTNKKLCVASMLRLHFLRKASKRLAFIINHNIFQSLHRKIWKYLILIIFSSTVKFTDVSTLIHFCNVFLKSLMKRYVIPNLMWRHRCFIILVLLLHYHDGWATTIWH